MDRIRSTVLLGAIALAGAAGLLLALSVGSAAGAVDNASGPSAQSPNRSTIAPPAPGAPIAVWQQWSSAQRAAILSTPWADLLAKTGCSLTSVSYHMHPASLGLTDAPAGVDTTAVDLTFHCANQQEPNFLKPPATYHDPFASSISSAPSQHNQ